MPDLPAFVLANRERLVLKPNDEYGGKGVVLGWTVTTGVGAALAAALASPPSCRRRSSPEGAVPDRPSTASEISTWPLDMDPYVFDGRPSGCLTRLSSRPC